MASSSTSPLKYVIDAIALKVVEVPDDYVECSVCHKWLPKSSYCDEHGVLARTNCEECCRMEHEELVELEKKTRDFISANWRSGKMDRLDMECRALRESITKEELVSMFNEAMAKIPDGAKVCAADYTNDDFGQPIEDYAMPCFDPTLKFDGKVWVI